MKSKNFNNVFIGVAWPYVNGDLHIGHYAGYLLPADISARYHRLKERNVLMVSGSDCFGTPITIEADRKKVSPSEIVEEYHARDVSLIKKLGLSYDLYTKTDTPNHKKISQEFFIKLMDEGYIFKDTSKQYYSLEEKRFLPDRYVEGKCPNCGHEAARSDQCDKCSAVLEQGELIDPYSRNTKTKVELRDTEHYFLDWPKLQIFLEGYLNEAHHHPLGWRQWVENETRGWLKKGLKPRAVTRDLDWGVELPTERIPAGQRIADIENKRIYVWFEAVIGYLSASIEWSEILKRGDWKSFWYGKDVFHYYFMGKDNLIFHTLFWPAQLHIYDPALHLPDFLAINQFLNLEGQKFSKSRGVIVDTSYVVEKYGNDPVRFYLCLIMPEESDSNFSWDDFYEKVNNVLIGNLGNFINRVLTLSKGVDFSRFTEADVYSKERNRLLTSQENVEEKLLKTFEDCEAFLESCKFKAYLESVLSLSSFGNFLMSIRSPWKYKEVSKEEFETIMFNLMVIVAALNYLVTPLLPDSSNRLSETLGTDLIARWPELASLTATLVSKVKESKIGEVVPLFSKVERSDIDAEKVKLPQ